MGKVELKCFARCSPFIQISLKFHQPSSRVEARERDNSRQ